MRRFGWLAAVLVVSGCTAQAQPTPVGSTTTAAPSAAVSLQASLTPLLPTGPGPGGMTLRQEVGAVVMAGFDGALTPAVLDDWRQRQFGGVLLLPRDHAGLDGAAIRNAIGSLRGVMTHPLLAATDVEGGRVCFTGAGVPCLAGGRQAAAAGAGAVQSAMAGMSQALKALGFDVNLAPEAELANGVDASTSELSYGVDANRVAGAVQAAVSGIHAAGMYAVAKHFENRDLAAFRAAIAARVDMVLVGDLSQSVAGGVDAGWPVLLHALRADLRFQGMAISDDLSAPAGRAGYSAGAIAVQFLESGGDMVMVSRDLGLADSVDDAIYDAVSNGSYPRAQLDASVQKLLSLSLRYLP